MKWFRSLLVTIILSLIILLSSHSKVVQLDNAQALTSNDLGIQSLFQHKDTPMLCLEGCPLYGKHAWDVVHETKSIDDVLSCTHCKWYCARASIAMINHYFGGNISQDRISYYVFGELYKESPWYYHPESDLGHGGIGPTATDHSISWVLNNATIYYQLGKPSLDQIEEWIDSNRPIMRWSGRHLTVIDGYDGQYVHVIDPAYAKESRILHSDLDIYEVWVPPANATARNDEPTVWMDSDSDGVVDFDEINRFFTDPYNPDTDGDLVPDKAEIRSYTFLSDDSFDGGDVRLPDSDGDGLRAELDKDSDNGGTPDGWEDLNRDGRVDVGETDPFNPADDPYEMPFAEFEFSPEEPKVMELVTFNASSSYDPDGTIISYEWSFDDGNITTVIDPVITHFYTEKGNYTVALNVTDNDGIWDVTTKTIEIEAVHAVAVTGVTPLKNVVGQNYTVNINCTVENKGDATETFNVTAYANTTLIETKEIILPSGNSTTIAFTWNTTNILKGNYTISANATLEGDINITNNCFIDGWIVVSIPGDINGDFTVNYQDLFLLASCYGSSTGDPNADLNNDGKVDYKDLFILAANYGKTA